MVFNCFLIVLKQCVCVSKTVASLGFYCLVFELSGELECLLVVFSRDVKSPKEDVCIAQVAVCSPLGCFVPKLLGDSQALQQTQINGVQAGTARLLLHSNFAGR